MPVNQAEEFVLRLCQRSFLVVGSPGSTSVHAYNPCKTAGPSKKILLDFP